MDRKSLNIFYIPPYFIIILFNSFCVHMLSYSEALVLVLENSIHLKSELINLENGLGKVLAEDIFADRDYPPFNRAAVDGYAFRLEDLNNDNVSFTCVEEIFAGDESQKNLNLFECYKIMTGAAVPLPADALIKVEDAVIQDNKIYFNNRPSKPFQNIALQGEDIKQNQIALKKDTLIQIGEISALASLGKNKIWVKGKPTVAIISTGNEIKNVDEEVNNFQIRDSNSLTIKSFFQKKGFEPNLILKINDNKESLKSAFESGLQNQILIISGGVSAGDADFVPQILASLGVKKIFHKVKIKPGKPIWFGKGENGQIVFALPGNPVSVQVALKIFVEPFLNSILAQDTKNYFFLPLDIEREQKIGFDEFVPCFKIQDNELNMTTVLPKKINGSGDITATLSIDGFFLHPSSSKTIEKNEMVKYYPIN